jgi:transcriptional regulator with XRE-family HTH domain
MGQTRTRLPALRANHERKLTQSAVARRAGMGLYRYWQIENGEGPDPSASEREAVAAALGVKVASIAWPVSRKALAS